MHRVTKFRGILGHTFGATRRAVRTPDASRRLLILAYEKIRYRIAAFRHLFTAERSMGAA